MNAEAQLQLALQNADLMVCTGSRLYGTARYNEQGECISDEDLRAVILPPLHYLIGLKTFDETNGKLSTDHVIYSLKKFLSMLLSGNFQCLELLFAPKEYIRTVSPLGNEIIGMRDLFVSKIYYKSITGYSYSEWNKVRGIQLVPVKKTDLQRRAIDSMKNAFSHLSKDQLHEAEKILYSGHQYEEVDAKNSVGEKRRAEYSKFGYCASCAHHALRVLYQCEELMRTGYMTFPRPEKELLSRVKRGEPTLGEIEAMRNYILERTQTAYDESKLPEKPDTNKVWKWYENIVLDWVKKSTM